MFVENASNQSSAENHATWVQRAGYVMVGVGIFLLGRALAVDDDTAFTRGAEAAGSALSMAASALTFRQASFMRGEVVIEQQVEVLEERLGIHDASKPPVNMAIEF